MPVAAQTTDNVTIAVHIVDNPANADQAVGAPTHQGQYHKVSRADNQYRNRHEAVRVRPGGFAAGHHSCL